MTEIRLTDKISKSIAGVFDKWEKIEFYVSSFLLISSIMGLTTIYLNYSHTTDLCTIKQSIAKNDTTLESIVHVNHLHNLNEQCKLNSELSTIEKQLSEIIENQKIIINHVEEIKNLNDIKFVNKSTNTSMNSFSPNKVSSLVIECTLDINEDNKEQDYDELSNECYDSIPLNNIKKHTNLSWLFK